MKAQIGLPVQLFANTTKGREAFAAIIVDLKEDSIHEEADLTVFTKESARIYARSVRHKDFKKDGENYWDFLEEEEMSTKKEGVTQKTESLPTQSEEYKTLLKYETFINTFFSKFDTNGLFKPLDDGLNLAYNILDELVRKGKPIN